MLVALGGGALLAGIALLGAARARRPVAEGAEVAHASRAGGAAASSANEIVEDGFRHEVAAWSFALADHELAIEDVGMGRALDALLESRRDAVLVVNGGFFDPEGRALGLALSNGTLLSKLARAASGGVVTFDGTRARLHETETFAMPEGTRFAIQCRPRLVVAGVPNVKRDDGKRSERTALCLRDGGATLDVVLVKAAAENAAEVPGPSLYALARGLAARGCEDALNLDGGPSTGVAARMPDGGATRELPRGPVRHAIVVKRR